MQKCTGKCLILLLYWQMCWYDLSQIAAPPLLSAVTDSQALSSIFSTFALAENIANALEAI